MNEDLSSLFEKFNIDKNSISPDMVNSLFNMINNNNTDNSSDNFSNSSTKEQTDSANGNNNSTNNIDFETIMRMKSIIEQINAKDDPRSNLLHSLKPYLKESRKSKVDQYVQLMNMSKVMDFFPFGGDKNSNGK